MGYGRTHGRIAFALAFVIWASSWVGVAIYDGDLNRFWLLGLVFSWGVITCFTVIVYPILIHIITYFRGR